MSEELKKAIKYTLDRNFKEGDRVVYTWDGVTGQAVIKRIDDVRNGIMKIRSAVIIPDDGSGQILVPLSVMFHAE